MRNQMSLVLSAVGKQVSGGPAHLAAGLLRVLARVRAAMGGGGGILTVFLKVTSTIRREIKYVCLGRGRVTFLSE